MKGADIFQEEEVFAEVLTLMKFPPYSLPPPLALSC